MNHRPRLEKELSELEAEYIKLCRSNPVSHNATVRMLERVDEIVDRMKAIRATRTIGRPVTGLYWLREILYS